MNKNMVGIFIVGPPQTKAISWSWTRSWRCRTKELITDMSGSSLAHIFVLFLEMITPRSKRDEARSTSNDTPMASLGDRYGSLLRRYGIIV